MKKVRYAIGAVGMAPALGLAGTAATASAAVQPATQPAAKTVSLQHSGAAPSKCHGPFSKTISMRSLHGNLFAELAVRGNCLVGVSGAIRPTSSSNRQHLMRTQVFSAHGAKVFSNESVSQIESGSPLWLETVGVRGARACETVFLKSRPHKALFGPMCEKF